VDFFDVTGSNNVAQRNMNINGCNFELPNTSVDPQSFDLRITTDAVVNGSEIVELVLPYIESWFTAWQALPEVDVTEDAGFMRVRRRRHRRFCGKWRRWSCGGGRPRWWHACRGRRGWGALLDRRPGRRDRRCSGPRHRVRMP